MESTAGYKGLTGSCVWYFGEQRKWEGKLSKGKLRRKVSLLPFGWLMLEMSVEITAEWFSGDLLLFCNHFVDNAAN